MESTTVAILVGEEDDLNLDGIPDNCQCIADVVPNGEVDSRPRYPLGVLVILASDIIADGDVGSVISCTS